MDSGKDLIEKAEKSIDRLEKEVVGGEADSTNSNVRYLAYLARIRPIVTTGARYLAYTSDVGEAFRPVVNPNFVRAAYGISWTYLIGDVSYEGYKARREVKETNVIGRDASMAVGLRVAERAVFQATASMLFPALTIHSLVKYSAKFIKSRNFKSQAVKAWGPTTLGLLAVPFLPYMFDKPIEHVTERAFGMLGEVVLKDDTRKALEKARKMHEIHGPSL